MEDTSSFDNEGRESDECRAASLVALTSAPFVMTVLMVLLLLLWLAV